MKKSAVIPAGTIFTISTGTYSDFYVHGVFRAVVDIDTNILLEEWLSVHPDQKEGFRFDQSGFIELIVRRGMIEQVESMEWFLGDCDPDGMGVEFYTQFPPKG